MNNQIDTERINSPKDQLTSNDKQSEQNAKQIVEAEELELQDQSNRILRDQDIYNFRKKGYETLFILIVGWLGLVGFVLIVNTFFSQFRLSDSVLISLLTTSTATVLGIFAIAAKWLFPKQ